MVYFTNNAEHCQQMEVFVGQWLNYCKCEIFQQTMFEFIQLWFPNGRSYLPKALVPTPSFHSLWIWIGAKVWECKKCLQHRVQWIVQNINACRPNCAQGCYKRHIHILHYMTLRCITLQLHYSRLHYVTIHYITLHDMTWHGMTWHGMTWHDMTWHKWHGMAWHDMTGHGIALHYITLHCIALHYITHTHIFIYSYTHVYMYITYTYTMFEGTLV